MRRFLLFALLGALCTVATAQKKATVIIQVTDPQMGFQSDNRDMKFEIAEYTKAVEAINRLHPDAVVFTGDYVHDRTNEAQWAEFNRITSLINQETRKVFIPGNHDVNLDEDGEVNDLPYLSHIGESDRFSLKINNVLITGLNSNLIKYENSEKDGKTALSDCEQGQIEWLEEALGQKKKGDVSIVFTHHPFFLNDIDEEEGYSTQAPDKRKLYFGIFKSHGVSYVFSGHLHDNAQASYEGIGMITTTAVGRQLGKAFPGVRVILVNGKKLTERFYLLDELSNLKREDL